MPRPPVVRRVRPLAPMAVVEGEAARAPPLGGTGARVSTLPTMGERANVLL